MDMWPIQSPRVLQDPPAARAGLQGGRLSRSLGVLHRPDTHSLEETLQFTNRSIASSQRGFEASAFDCRLPPSQLPPHLPDL